MTKSTYEPALRRLLVHEGGYSNHPSDPGGPTNFGITIADYRRYVKPAATAADVHAMPVAEANAIYRARYWEAMRCDDLPAGLDYAVFDYGVNSGNTRAVKVLQRILGLADDGKMADAVLAAANKSDAAKLVTALCDERLRFLQSLKTWPVFGAGWGRRVAEVKAAGLAMASAGVAPRQPAGKTQGKGAVPVPAGAQKSASGAVVAGGAAAAHQAAQDGVSTAVVITIILVAFLIAGVAWAAFHWWQRRKQEAPVSAEILG
jgi:lysozyme family protein